MLFLPTTAGSDKHILLLLLLNFYYTQEKLGITYTAAFKLYDTYNVVNKLLTL